MLGTGAHNVGRQAGAGLGFSNLRNAVGVADRNFALLTLAKVPCRAGGRGTMFGAN